MYLIYKGDSSASGERTFQTFANLFVSRQHVSNLSRLPVMSQLSGVPFADMSGMPDVPSDQCPPIPAACPGTTNAADPISMTIDGPTGKIIMRINLQKLF
jgi:hypothetical protein